MNSSWERRSAEKTRVAGKYGPYAGEAMVCEVPPENLPVSMDLPGEIFEDIRSRGVEGEKIEIPVLEEVVKIEKPLEVK